MQIRDILIFALSDAEQLGCDNNVTVVICYLYLNHPSQIRNADM